MRAAASLCGMAMAHIEPRITKSGKTRWRAMVRVAGFPRKIGTFDKKQEARDWAQALEADMRAGRYGGDLLARKHTVGDMITRYIDNVLESKSDRPRFIEAQRQQLAWWRDEIGAAKLVNLQPLLLSQCRDKLAGKNYSTRKPATVNRYFAALSHVINTAIKEWGWLHANPIAKMNMPKEPGGRVRYLTEAERDALLDACKQERRVPLYTIVMFALCTGARKGEILALKAKDVDFTRMIAIAYDTKNGEPRTLYLSEHVCELLKHCVFRSLLTPIPKSKRGNKGLVFTSRAGTAVNIEVAWRRALRRSGITDFRFHDLRHTAASYLAMNGASPSEIGEVLGHKSYDMVKRYSHLSTTHVGGVVRSMNQAMLSQQQGVNL